MIAVALVLALRGPSEFGLIPGTQRTFEITTSAGDKQEYSTVVKEAQVVQKMDTFPVGPKKGPYRFLGVSPDGLFEFYHRNMDGTEVDPITKPIPLYLRKTKVGECWSFVEEFRGQVMAGPNGKGPDTSDFQTHCRATLISANEQLKTAIGSFETVHVQVQRKSNGLGNSTTDSWYAPQIGLVKETVTADKWWRQLIVIR